jgi:hypothetical protein
MERVVLMTIVLMLWIGLLPQKAIAQNCPGTLMSQEWTECHNEVINSCAFVSPSQSDACRAAALRRWYYQTQQRQHQQQLSGAVAPVSAWQCPSTHVIKGNFTTYNGERCIFHIPSGQFYSRTKPEMCYRTPQDAIADGCRQSLR